MNGRKAFGFGDPGVCDVISPFRKNSELKDNFVYITGPAEVIVSFAPCFGTGETEPVFKDNHTWSGECEDKTPWEVALKNCGNGDHEVASVKQTDEKKKVIVAINFDSQVTNDEGKTDEELAIEREKELEEKKALSADGTNTVTIDRYIWQATLVFKTQATMVAFTKSSWSTRPFIAGHPTLKISYEGQVVCRATGAVLKASNVDSYINTERFLTCIFNKKLRTLTQVYQTASNVVQRRNFVIDILPRLSAGHDITVVDDANGVPRFIKVAVKNPPPNQLVGLKLIIWGSESVYTRCDLFDGTVVQRSPSEIIAELERRLRDIFQITPSEATINVLYSRLTEPVVRLVREDLEYSHCGTAEQAYSVVIINAQPVVANRLLQRRGEYIPHLSKGHFAISGRDLWFDMATYATMDVVDENTDALHPATHPPATPLIDALHRLVKYGLGALDGSLYDSVIKFPEELVPTSTPEEQGIDAKIEAQLTDKSIRNGILPGAKKSFADFIRRRDDKQPDAETIERLADLRQKFNVIAKTHQEQVEKDRQTRLTDRAALTAVLFRQHSGSTDQLKVVQCVDGEGAHAATVVKVVVKDRVLGSANGFKKDRVEVVKAALTNAVQAEPYPEATETDYAMGQLHLPTWWQQIFKYVEEKPPPDEQLEVIRENIQRDQHREAIRTIREEEEFDRRRKPTPVPRPGVPPPSKSVPTPVARPVTRVSPAVPAPVAASVPAPIARSVPAPRSQAAPAKPVAAAPRVPPPRGVVVPGGQPAKAAAAAAAPTGRSRWNSQAEQWFFSLLAERLVSISAPVITGLAQQANSCIQEGRSGAAEIITALEKRLYSNIPARLNLATWYLLDALMKGPNSRQFIQAVSPKIDVLVERTLPNRLDSSLNDQCRQLIETWKNLFPPELLETLRRSY